MLVHHADPQPDRVFRALDLDRLAVNTDFSLIRHSHAVEDFHQRRFAGSIFSQQGMNLSLT